MVLKSQRDRFHDSGEDMAAGKNERAGRKIEKLGDHMMSALRKREHSLLGALFTGEEIVVFTSLSLKRNSALQ